MSKSPISFTLICLSMMACAQARAERKPIVVEQGTYTIHMLLHAIGTESYTVTDEGDGHQRLTITATSSDRGMKRSLTSTLEMGPRATPLQLDQDLTTTSGEVRSITQVKGTSVSVQEGDTTRTLRTPPVAFMGFASMPASLQMMMIRYWKLHHQPAQLPMLRASSQALPLEIKLVGHDSFSTSHGMVRLTRYTVANLMFGREIVWMNDDGRLAALMTFAGGLPIEEVRDDYASIGGELVRSGVQQEMLDLDDLDRQVPPEAAGEFAIVGARLIDGTGAPAIENSVVIVRDGRILAAGAAASTPVPPGVRVIHADGKSLLPGLWEMHAHYSGVEFGPALLAAGVTTARDCGGEFEFLTTLRNKIDTEHALGPKLLLAGLIDSGDALGFGYVDANTPAEGIAAVDTYADAKFDQIKVYTQLQPNVLRAITAEAHKRGLTVTGHVPAAINAFDGVADGMDQINHLQFVTHAMLRGRSQGTGRRQLRTGAAAHRAAEGPQHRRRSHRRLGRDGRPPEEHRRCLVRARHQRRAVHPRLQVSRHGLARRGRGEVSRPHGDQSQGHPCALRSRRDHRSRQRHRTSGLWIGSRARAICPGGHDPDAGHRVRDHRAGTRDAPRPRLRIDRGRQTRRSDARRRQSPRKHQRSPSRRQRRQGRPHVRQRATRPQRRLPSRRGDRSFDQANIPRRSAGHATK